MFKIRRSDLSDHVKLVSKVFPVVTVAARAMAVLAVLVVMLGVNDSWGQDYFAIEVLDSQTGRGVPLVEVQSPSGQSYYTDSQGIVAFDEPGAMNQNLAFTLNSYGYAGTNQTLQTNAGSSGSIQIKRINRAERLYRATGAGIYQDSVQVQRSVPINNPLLNANVQGQDSVQAAIYKGQLRWFWGDTLYETGGLGNFRVSGATSLLPSQGGLSPSQGVDLEYFVNANGWSRSMVPSTDPGPIWIDGLFAVEDASGTEQLFAHFVRVQSFVPYLLYEQGLVQYDDATDTFSRIQQYNLDAALTPAGHSFHHDVAGEPHVYFAQDYPNVRVKANASDVLDIGSWEAFTPLKEGSTYDPSNPALERDANGQPIYSWKRNTDPLSSAMLHELVQNGHLDRADAPFRLRDVESGNDIYLHRASVYWNEFRDAWVMIGNEIFGDSFLGEVYYAEAPTPEGPWKGAIKVATHDSPDGDYDFYNPKTHPFFNEQGGQIIFFEGTYSNSFAGGAATPLYNYNQIMYRLDLATIPNLLVNLADINDDGSFDCDDANALVAAIADGGTALRFDLNGDRVVDRLDLSRWRELAGTANLGEGNVYLEGDANLDGIVDGQDFSFQLEGCSWRSSLPALSVQRHSVGTVSGKASGSGVDGIDRRSSNLLALLGLVRHRRTGTDRGSGCGRGHTSLSAVARPSPAGRAPAGQPRLRCENETNSFEILYGTPTHAAWALAQLGDLSGVPVLAELLDSELALVRDHAQRLLQEITGQPQALTSPAMSYPPFPPPKEPDMPRIFLRLLTYSFWALLSILSFGPLSATAANGVLRGHQRKRLLVGQAGRAERGKNRRALRLAPEST